MKKLLMLALAVAIIAGCGGKEPEPVEPPSQIRNQCLAGSPDWVITGRGEGGFTSMGSAKITKAGYQFARTAAIGNARDEMARAIEVKVNNMLKDFTQVTGIGDDEVVDKVTSTVSKQVASQTLKGTTPVHIWESNCGELYVLISSDPSIVQTSVKNAVSSSYKNDNAMWQQFLQQKAQDELDAAVAKEFPSN